MQSNESSYWLVVEDSADDFLLLERACLQLHSPPRLERLTNAGAVWELLGGDSKYPFSRPHPLPSLVLSDLNMPRMSGLELLAWFKSQARLRAIPFLLLTSSASPIHRSQAGRLGADDFLIKPGDLIGLVEMNRGVAERYSPAVLGRGHLPADRPTCYKE